MPNFTAGVENLPSFVAIGAMARYSSEKAIGWPLQAEMVA